VITVTLGGGEVGGDQVEAEAEAILAELHAAATMLRGKEEALKLHTRRVMRQRLAARRSAAAVSESDSEIGKLLDSAMPELQKDLHQLDQQVKQQRQQLTQSHGNELARLLTVHGKLPLTASTGAHYSVLTGGEGLEHHETQLAAARAVASDTARAAAHTAQFGTSSEELTEALRERHAELLAKLNATYPIF
jgi:hypothetical protein